MDAGPRDVDPRGRPRRRAPRSPTCPGRCWPSCSPTPWTPSGRSRTARRCAWWPPTRSAPGSSGEDSDPDEVRGPAAGLAAWLVGRSKGRDLRTRGRQPAARAAAMAVARPPDGPAGCAVACEARPGANAPGRRARLRCRARRVRAAHRVPAGRAGRGRPGRPPATGPGPDRVDATDVELVTIDPPGSKDLDQAVGVTRRGDGFRVHYAIADLGAVVVPGGAAGRRGAPPRADRLPARRLGAPAPAGAVRGRGQPAAGRPAGRGAVDHRPGRRPASRARSTCAAHWCAPGPGWTTRACRPTSRPGRLHPAIAALPELGRLRRALAVRRGAIELELPEQEVVRAPDGRLDRADPHRGSTSRPGTRRSRCSPGWPRPRSCSPAGSGCCARCPRRSRPRSPSSGAPPNAGRVAGRTAPPRPRCWPGCRWTPRTRWRCAGRPPPCCAGPATRRSTRRPAPRRPPIRGTAGSGRRTRTSPRRCGGWWTASAPRSAWP